MKKFIAIILAAFYLTSSTGVNVSLHYCMGELADWAVGHTAPDTCGNCGMEKSSEKKNDCCKDDHKFLKDNSAQKATESSVQFISMLGTAIVPVYAETPAVQIPSVTEEYPVSNGPPRSHTVAVYILNRTFLI